MSDSVGLDVDIDKAVAASLPGWEVVRNKTGGLMKKARGLGRKTKDPVNVHPGMSYSDLKRQFLKANPNAVVDSDGSYGPVRTDIQTIRVRPKNGGPAKTADVNLKTGKVEIIQG